MRHISNSHITGKTAAPANMGRRSTSQASGPLQAAAATQASGQGAWERDPREGSRTDTAGVTPKPSNSACASAGPLETL